MQTDAELQALMADIDRQRVERARKTPIEQKFLAGFRMYMRSRMLMKAGARMEFPDASEEELERIIERRLELLRDKTEYRP